MGKLGVMSKLKYTVAVHAPAAHDVCKLQCKTLVLPHQSFNTVTAPVTFIARTGTLFQNNKYLE